MSTPPRGSTAGAIRSLALAGARAARRRPGSVRLPPLRLPRVPAGDDVWQEALEAPLDLVPVIVQDPVWEQSFPDVGGRRPAARRSGDAAGLVHVRLSRRGRAGAPRAEPSAAPADPRPVRRARARLGPALVARSRARARRRSSSGRWCVTRGRGSRDERYVLPARRGARGGRAAAVALVVIAAAMAPRPASGRRPPASPVEMETSVTPSRYIFGDELARRDPPDGRHARGSIRPTSISVPVFRPFQRVAPIEIERRGPGRHVPSCTSATRSSASSGHASPTAPSSVLDLPLGLVRYTPRAGRQRHAAAVRSRPSTVVDEAVRRRPAATSARRPATLGRPGSADELPPLRSAAARRSSAGCSSAPRRRSCSPSAAGWPGGSGRAGVARRAESPRQPVAAAAPGGARAGRSAPLAGGEAERRIALDELARRLGDAGRRELAGEATAARLVEAGPQRTRGRSSLRRSRPRNATTGGGLMRAPGGSWLAARRRARRGRLLAARARAPRPLPLADAAALRRGRPPNGAVRAGLVARAIGVVSPRRIVTAPRPTGELDELVASGTEHRRRPRHLPERVRPRLPGDRADARGHRDLGRRERKRRPRALLRQRPGGAAPRLARGGARARSSATSSRGSERGVAAQARSTTGPPGPTEQAPTQYPLNPWFGRFSRRDADLDRDFAPPASRSSGTA